MIPARLVNVLKHVKIPLQPARSISSLPLTCRYERPREYLWRLTNAKCIGRTLTFYSPRMIQVSEGERDNQLITRVKMAKSSDILLSIVHNHQNELTTDELYKIFIYLDLVSHNEGSSRKVKNDHPGFILLCEEIRKRASHLSQVLLHSAVYFICRHGVETSVTKSVAESLKEPLTKLSWKGVHNALGCLSKAKNSAPFTSYMKDYLKLALEVKLSAVLEKNGHLDEIQAFLSSCTFDLSDVLQQKLLTRVVERDRNLTVDQAKSVLLALANVRGWNSEASESVQLWNRAMRTFTSNMSAYPTPIFSTLFYLWAENLWHKTRSLLPLPEELCQEAARRAVDEKWSWKSCTTLASAFAKKGFVHGDFLDYCIEQEMTTGRNVVGLRVLGDLNYKPRQFEAYFKFCVKNIVEESNLQFLYRLLSCAVFGFYPLPLIKQLFGSPKIGPWLEDPDKYIEELRLLERLQQGVRAECPRYRGPFPPEQVSTLVRQKLEKVLLRSPIEDYLVPLVGGPSYVAGRVFPKHGFHIGHLLVRDTSGSLVPFNTVTDGAIQHDLEVFDIPPESQRIAVQLCQHRAFLSDGKNLRGHKLLETRVLQKLGFTVTNVNVGHFLRLPEHEKIPFLLDEIGLSSGHR